MIKAAFIFVSAFIALILFSGYRTAKNRKQNHIEENAYKYFCELLGIPHGSGNEKAVSDYLVAFAKENRLDAVQDSAKNVLIRKNGSRGRENEPPVILQVHMDMVCEKNDGVVHDFRKDPIIPIVDGDWIRAEGTTLGADNAGGVSIVMALLAAKKLSHPPIEALITTEEETSMGGAGNFNISQLKGRRFINMDAEADGVFVVSTAGGATAVTTLMVEREDVPEGFAAYKLVVKDLASGHSGIDIHKGLANANVLMARLLDTLNEENICLTEISGGSAMNVIPKEAAAVIFFSESRLEIIKASLARMESEFKAEYPLDINLTISLERAAASGTVITRASFRKLIDCILTTPNGVQSMSPDFEGLVQTSNNLAIIAVPDPSKVVLRSFLRSSAPPDLIHVIEKLKTQAEKTGALVTSSIGAPAWEYKADSRLRNTMAGVFMELNDGRPPKISALHAGLEISIFAPKMPDGDFISIGPTILSAHTTGERMSKSSFDRTCNFMVKVLEKL